MGKACKFACIQIWPGCKDRLADRCSPLFLQLVGFFVFRQGDFGVLNVCGIAVNTFGGFWYTAAKFQQRRKKLKESPLPKSNKMSASSQHLHKMLPTASGNLLPLMEAARDDSPQQVTSQHRYRENGHMAPLKIGSADKGRDPAEVLTPGVNIRDRGLVYAEDHRERADNSLHSSPRHQSRTTHKGHGKGSADELV